MASSQSRIAELATIVADHTQRVDNYLAEKGLPHPSFEVDGPIDMELPPEIEALALECSKQAKSSMTCFKDRGIYFLIMKSVSILMRRSTTS
jgi:hypothetical protein